MAYPGHREVDVALRDGSTVHVRPVRATDAPAVRAFFERLSPESTGLRFFSGFPNLDSAVSWATEVDDQRRYSLVATSGDGRVLAHAGWERDPDRPERAEVALAIADAMQGKGLGTILLGQLAEAADQAGIGVLGAEVLPHNHQDGQGVPRQRLPGQDPRRSRRSPGGGVDVADPGGAGAVRAARADRGGGGHARCSWRHGRWR